MIKKKKTKMYPMLNIQNLKNFILVICHRLLFRTAGKHNIKIREAKLFRPTRKHPNGRMMKISQSIWIKKRVSNSI